MSTTLRAPPGFLVPAAATVAQIYPVNHQQYVQHCLGAKQLRFGVSLLVAITHIAPHNEIMGYTKSNATPKKGMGLFNLIGKGMIYAHTHKQSTMRSMARSPRAAAPSCGSSSQC